MSLSLFGVLNMAGQSLSVEQEATSVAGQNLANVNNPAYAEQQLEVQAATPLQTTSGEEGTGVQAVGITQIWDSLLNSQITAEGSVTGSLTSQQSALQQAEAYLNEQLSVSSSSTAASSSAGLTADITNFFSTLQTLSTDPSSIPDRQAVIQAAQSIATQINSFNAGISTVTSDLNSSIQSDVTSANQDMTQIASLNQQIVAAQSDGGSANDLVDQREQLLENLAGYVNITTSAQTNGAVNISIGGVTMVSGDTTPDSLGTYTGANGQPLIQAQAAGAPLTLSGGSIEGSITARDGAIATLQSSVNSTVGGLINEVDSTYSTGYDLHGNTGQVLFTVDNGQCGINGTLLNDPSTFQAAGSPGNPGDNTVVLSLIQIGNTATGFFNNQTPMQSYTTAVGAFGSSLESVNEQLSNSTSISQMLTRQRSSETGVDTDTEMTNLMQFQKAYEASAELVTTVNQMLEAVLQMGAA